jgi:hypothetical protein
MRTETELRQFWNEHAEWSQKTFGLDSVRGPQGPLNHLAKEVKEALAKPNDPSEYADLLLLMFDAARRSGLTFDGLIGAAWGKLDVNKKRQWGKPNDDGSVEHVRPTGEDAWQSTDRHCNKCGCKGAVVYRVHEASDGGHEDFEYRCQSCNYTFWIDGIDS